MDVRLDARNRRDSPEFRSPTIREIVADSHNGRLWNGRYWRKAAVRRERSADMLTIALDFFAIITLAANGSLE